MALFGPKATDDTAAVERELARLSEIVTVGLGHFVTVGDALAEIRDRQLYRVAAGTFEAYCRDQWGMSGSHAMRLIDAANIARTLSPIGGVLQNEHQARLLKPLSEETRVEAWLEASEHADEQGLVPTAAIKASVAKRSPKKPRKTKSLRPIRIRVPGASVIVEPNKHYSGDIVKALTDAIAKLAETEGRKAA
jgi:hypothetical protein